MAEKRKFFQRLLHIEPGIALGQWIYDRITNNWALLLAATGGTVMSVLAAVSEFLKPYGPFGIGAAAIIFALLVWLTLAASTLLFAKAGLKRAERSAVEKWKEQVETVNPLDDEFNRRRLRVTDLANPITGVIANKKIINCELIGPANIAFRGGFDARGGIYFERCEVVVSPVEKTRTIYNVIILHNAEVFNTTIIGCTIYITEDIVELFAGIGANIVTLTGHPDIDNPQQQDIEEETRP